MALFIVFSFSRLAPGGIAPNLILVFTIILAFFAEDFYDFILFSLLGILWSKYSSFFSWEYVVLFAVGIASFFLFKLMVLKKNFLIPLLALLVFQIIFWSVLSGFDLIFSLEFLLEFLYNGVVLGLFFFLGLWLEKKFY